MIIAVLGGMKHPIGAFIGAIVFVLMGPLMVEGAYFAVSATWSATSRLAQGCSSGIPAATSAPSIGFSILITRAPRSARCCRTTSATWPASRSVCRWSRR